MTRTLLAFLLVAICALSIEGVSRHHFSGGIVSGEETYRHEYPWNVALKIKSSSGPTFCGGSLVGHEYVLTSAHCIDGAIEIEVIMGAHDITVNENEQVRMTSRKFYTHGSWNSKTLQNDIGLVKLPSSVEYSSSIQPIDLWYRVDKWVGYTSNMTGWGKTSLQSGLSAVLRKTEVKFINDDECIKKYPNYYDSSIHFCVTGGTMCEGDEGGPLSYYSLSTGYLYLAGIATYSAPEACDGDSNYPSIYTQTYVYYDWVNQYTPLYQWRT